MNKDILKSIDQNLNFSVKHTGEIFANFLKENPISKNMIQELCSSLPEFAREQNVNIAINTARWWLNELKNTIT